MSSARTSITNWVISGRCRTTRTPTSKHLPPRPRLWTCALTRDRTRRRISEKTKAMPDCPPRSSEERKSDRWEYTAGKALKDWVTRAMKKTGKNRAEARFAILEKINEADQL